MASSMKLTAGYPSTSSSSAVPPLPTQPQAPVLETPQPSNAPGQRESVTESDGVLSLDVAEKMLKWHAEAIGRCVEMSPQSDM